MRPEGVKFSEWLKYNTLFVMEHFFGKNYSKNHLYGSKYSMYEKAIRQPRIADRSTLMDNTEIEYDSFEPFRKNKRRLLNQPIVFKGVAKDWPCSKRWSDQFFAEEYGDTMVPLIDQLPGIRDTRSENPYTKISFKDYYKELERGNKIYLSFSRVLDHNTELLNDLDIDWLRQFKYGLCNGEQTFFFMGEEGTKTSLHCGFTHTLFIQIRGRKKWTLWHPEERFFLDPIADRYTHFYSHADPNNFEDQQYPIFKYAKRYEIVLEPGDVLWFPSMFWHHVENLTPTIGVAFKYVNVFQSFQISKIMTSLILMATKPNLVQSFLYNRKHKQDHVFSK